MRTSTVVRMNRSNAILSQEGRGKRRTMPPARAEAWRSSGTVIVPNVLQTLDVAAFSETDLVHHFTHNAITGKKFRRQAARRPGVAAVVGPDLVDRGDRTRRVGIFEQAFADRVEATEFRGHGHDRAPRCEIADAAVAEPAAFGSNINILGNSKFTTRGSDKTRIGFERRRNGARIDKIPALARHERLDLGRGRQHRHGEALLTA